MSEIIDLNEWRQRQAEAEEQAKLEQESATAAFGDHDEWALKFSWEAHEVLGGSNEVSSYLRVPLRTFEQALREFEVQQAKKVDK